MRADQRPWRQLTGFRAGVIAISIVTLVAAASILWWLRDDDAPIADATPPNFSAGLAALPAVVTPASVPQVVAEANAPGSDEVQICGGSWVKLGPDGNVAWDSVEKVSRAGVDALAAKVLTAMESSGDERAQAAAHFFQSAGIRLARIRAAGCNADLDCQRDAAAKVQDSLGHRDALARLAQSATDPQVYAWAVQACNADEQSAGGFCQLISAAQWARLDASNAAPWIDVAEKAGAQLDAAGVDDALFHVAMAARHDTGSGVLAALLLEHTPSGEGDLIGALELSVRAVGIDAVLDIPPAQTLNGLCRVGDLADSNRREVCSRIGDLLAGRSTTLLAHAIGRGLGKRLGWPAERIKVLEQERDAFLAVASQDARAGAQMLTCRDLQSQLQRIRDSAALGELEALRRRVGETGTSNAEAGANDRR